MNRADFQHLAKVRLAEAEALLAAGFPSGAYYLGGYAIEFAIKACIAKTVQQYDFPDKDRVVSSYVHDLVKLIKIAGLESDLNSAKVNNKAFDTNWVIVKDWNEKSRYSAAITVPIATSLIMAINDAKDGVLQWLIQRW